jgi:hypothetical protein
MTLQFPSYEDDNENNKAHPDVGDYDDRQRRWEVIQIYVNVLWGPQHVDVDLYHLPPPSSVSIITDIRMRLVVLVVVLLASPPTRNIIMFVVLGRTSPRSNLTK